MLFIILRDAYCRAVAGNETAATDLGIPNVCWHTPAQAELGQATLESKQERLL